MSRKIIYAMQDGPDFYIYADSNGDHLERTMSAPLTVGLNLALALKARQWFEAFVGEAGLKIEWINPFCPSRLERPASRVTNMIDMSGYTGDDLEF
jgi:hypothetical protein